MLPPTENPMSFSEQAVVLVPTLNPGPNWAAFLDGLLTQHPAPARTVVLDSESNDGCQALASEAGLQIHSVSRTCFSHGGTRQLGIDLFGGEAHFAVFLTQDAMLKDTHALAQLLSGFQDPSVAAVYGRQLPLAEASAISCHARQFNYPAQSHTLRWADKDRLGFKTCFLSNAFAAYRIAALRQVGGFSPQVILGEDTQLAARLLMAGHAIRYEAQAVVYHSHNYSLASEFARYFDTGVFHHDERWMTEQFGNAGNEGFKFLKSECLFLLRHAPWHLPEALLRTLLKALAYRLGRSHPRLPLPLKKRLSMHPGFWS